MEQVKESKEMKRNKRKAELQAEEERLSKLLFGEGEDIIEALNEQHSDNKTISETETKTRVPAWQDEEDSQITIEQALRTQKRKLPKGGINEPSNQYRKHLTHKFENIHGNPEWAKLTSKTDEEIFKSNLFINPHKSKNLPKSIIDIKRVTDLNKQTYSEGPIIKSVEFHPSSSVALVSGLNGVISIYTVNGKLNEKLHTIAYDRFPIHTSKFTQNGEECIIGGQLKHYHCYNLITGSNRRFVLPHDITNMKLFSVYEDYITVAGKFGEIFLLNSKSKELLATMKQGTRCTGMCFSRDGLRLYCHGSENECTVFDLRERRVCQKFYDDGCISGSSIAVSDNGEFLATGSAEGVVNLYRTHNLNLQSPKPIKTIMNLTTSITSLEFNSTSEILAMCSGDSENSVKLVHLSSLTVFQNFPGFQANIGRPGQVRFSPGSGYMALTSNKNVVPLYRVKFYSNY